MLKREKAKVDWFKENYPTGRLYTFTGSRQGFLPGFSAEGTFVNGRPYLLVRWSQRTNPYSRGSSFLKSGYVYAPHVPLQTTPTFLGEKCGFLSAVFFVGGVEVLVDPGMLKEFEII